jgi:hypothetical protein
MGDIHRAFWRPYNNNDGRNLIHCKRRLKVTFNKPTMSRYLEYELLSYQLNLYLIMILITLQNI